jgi:hypothetical protein
MNLLPSEPLENVVNPAGIRLGVQEMTRMGMKEPEMEIIACLFKRCLLEGRHVAAEVSEFRRGFQQVAYSYDWESAAPDAGARAELAARQESVCARPETPEPVRA